MNAPERWLAGDLAARLAAIDGQALGAALDAEGWARVEGLLTRAECESLAASYDDEGRSAAAL